MNIEDIVWRLAQLASLPFQERYVIQADSEGYLLDSELLENVDSLKFLLRRSEHKHLVTNDQLSALEDLFLCIEKESGDALSANSREQGAFLIRESDVWKELRQKATYALTLFGVAIEKMSAEQVASLSE
jgi:hypothetical protein